MICACNGGQKCFIPLIFVLKGYVKNHLARCSSYPMGGVSWDTSWGKLSMDRKSEPLLFPGAAKSGLFYLLHGIHTYGKVFFPPSKSDCFKPSNNSSSFLSRKKSFYPSDNLQITYNLCNQQRKTISYHFYSAETSAAQFGFRQRRQQWLIRLIFPQVKMAHLAPPVAIFD